MPYNHFIEFIKDKLYFSAVRRVPSDEPDYSFFSVDDKFPYTPFYNDYDFGPVNLGQTHLFCNAVEDEMEKLKNGQKLVIVTSHDVHLRSNAAWLIAAFMVIVHGQTPEQSYAPLKTMYPPFKPFRDASTTPSFYDLSILSCLKGLHKALRLKFYNYNSFDANSYLHFEQVENGDFNWIIPGKVLAFAGPKSTQFSPSGLIQFTPEDYHELFLEAGVTAIVRLNKKVYNRQRFLKLGFNHYDLFFPDGSLPTDRIVNRFFKLWENEECLAIHCKAGLGRTGTLIGACMMKYYGMTADETIAWLRIARPGSVIAVQQNYLIMIETALRKEGKRFHTKLLKEIKKKKRKKKRSKKRRKQTLPRPETTIERSYSPTKERKTASRSLNASTPFPILHATIKGNKAESDAESTFIETISNIAYPQVKKNEEHSTGITIQQVRPMTTAGIHKYMLGGTVKSLNDHRTVFHETSPIKQLPTMPALNFTRNYALTK
mmetsp:Transcript_14268/g.21571  ORF Transcript_14268/g.21571 Transcript_14268/m.21571 type:complete len:488 (+) Transcript_14268:25-1488(+)